MILGLMQPYYFPYIGYFQLIHAVDIFIIYDTVNYIKNGWIKRNRYLLNNTVKYFTLSINNASSNKLIIDTYIADEEKLHTKERNLKTIHMAYSKAPYYNHVINMLDELILNDEKNISLYNTNILREISKYLGINTKIYLGSKVLNNSHLKGQNRVIEICEQFKAKEYINPIGGVELYDNKTFADHNIKLSFLKTSERIQYHQWNNEFYPNLSIIDILMFNSKENISSMLEEYSLI